MFCYITNITINRLETRSMLCDNPDLLGPNILYCPKQTKLNRHHCFWTGWASLPDKKTLMASDDVIKNILISLSLNTV